MTLTWTCRKDGKDITTTLLIAVASYKLQNKSEGQSQK